MILSTYYPYLDDSAIQSADALHVLVLEARVVSVVVMVSKAMQGLTRRWIAVRGMGSHACASGSKGGTQRQYHTVGQSAHSSSLSASLPCLCLNVVLHPTPQFKRPYKVPYRAHRARHENASHKATFVRRQLVLDSDPRLSGGAASVRKVNLCDS